MPKTWVTSDLHFNHDRGFLYEPRGYKSVGEMNENILKNYNEVVSDEDTVFILGDLTLNDLESAKSYLTKLKGHITVIRGNHDSNQRVEFYKQMGWEVYDALRIKYKKLNFFLCHYPTITANLETESMYQTTICLYGHTHQQTNFYQDMPFCYHVGVDSHNNYPVNMDTVIEDIKNKIEECKNLL